MLIGHRWLRYLRHVGCILGAVLGSLLPARAEFFAGDYQKSLPTSPAKQTNISLLTRSQRHQALREAVLHDDIRRARDLIHAGTTVRLRVRPDHPYLRMMPDGFSLSVGSDKLPTLLMVAVAQKERDLIELLLNNRAPVNATGTYLLVDSPSSDAHYLSWLRDGTALHIAAFEGDVPMLDRLIRAGATVDIQDADGRTPLHWAIEEQKTSVVSRLIQAHCNVNLADKRGESPLQKAAAWSDREIYDKLKRAGAIGSYKLSDPARPTPIALMTPLQRR